MLNGLVADRIGHRQTKSAPGTRHWLADLKGHVFAWAVSPMMTGRRAVCPLMPTCRRWTTGPMPRSEIFSVKAGGEDAGQD